MATYRRTEDLINLGAYVTGASPKVDAAVRVREHMEDFLKQAPGAKVALQTAEAAKPPQPVASNPETKGDKPEAQAK